MLADNRKAKLKFLIGVCAESGVRSLVALLSKGDLTKVCSRLQMPIPESEAQRKNLLRYVRQAERGVAAVRGFFVVWWFSF